MRWNRWYTAKSYLLSTHWLSPMIALVASLFPIDYAARLLRPVSIVWRISKDGLAVIENLYPEPARDPTASECGRSPPRTDSYDAPARRCRMRGSGALARDQRSDDGGIGHRAAAPPAPLRRPAWETRHDERQRSGDPHPGL